MSLTIGLTKRNKTKLFYEQYAYVNDKTSTSKIYWRCERYATCSARLQTDISITSVCGGLPVRHNHEPCNKDEQLAINKAKSLVQENAFAKPCQILSKLMKDASSSTAMPESASILASIRYERRKRKLSNEITLENVNDFEVKTVDEDSFVIKNLMIESGIIIFGTEHNVERLLSCTEFMIDGTFDIVPTEFYQLLTIMGRKYSRWFPLVFVLMCDKKEASYDTIWEEILDLAQRMDWNIPDKPLLHVDFEKAISNSFLKFFPDGNVSHCLFHLGQSVYRKILSLGLSSKYSEDEKWRELVRMLVGLAFLKPEEVTNTFLELAAEIKETNLTEYFDETYVRGRLIRTCKTKEIRDKPQYSIHSWNVHNSFQDNLDRTNNVIEAYHKSIKLISGKSHLSLHSLVDLLLATNQKTEHSIRSHLANGAVSQKKTLKRQKCDSAIQNLFHQYSSGEMSRNDFLFGMQRNIHMH